MNKHNPKAHAPRQSLSKQLRAFVQKEFLHILRDPYTLMILLLMPIVEMLLFGFALNMDVTNLKTIVIDHARDRYAQKLIDKIEHNPDFILIDHSADVKGISEMMQANRADVAFIIPEGLERDLTTQTHTEIGVIIDATDPNAAKIISGYASALIYALIEEDQQSQYGHSTPLQAEGLQQPTLQIETRMLYNPTMHSSYNFVPGVMGLVLVILCTIMTSVSIAREKERGNMELLLASPAHSTILVIAKAIPYFFLSLINLATILLLSYFVLGVPIRGSLAVILLLSMLYILLSLAIGLAISSLVSSQRDAILISGFGMMMPTIIFGGMLFPIANMPQVLQWISYIVPARYYISGCRKVMIQGLPISGITEELIILALLAFILTLLAIVNVRPRLK